LVSTFNVPSVTTEQMREVDRLMIEEYGISLLQMMENAGRNLARLAAELNQGPESRGLLVLVGRGNNGGGGMVAARHLHNMGSRLRVVLDGPVDGLTDVPARQASILVRMGIDVAEADDTAEGLAADTFTGAGLIIDALTGYGLRGAPHGIVAAIINKASASGAPVLSLDVPSGVHAGTGEVSEPSINAAATLTLALPKTGFDSPEARARLGDLYLGDISVPPSLYHRLGLDVPSMFARRSVVRLLRTAEGWQSER
jgi:NAD(P)H-hydrate epimerase